MTAEAFLKVQGHSPQIVNERRRIVETIYSRSGSKISEDVFSHLNKTSGKSDVYIVARNLTFNNNLENDTHVAKVFENAETAVYKLLKKVEKHN